jgi:hypothetical protein
VSDRPVAANTAIGGLDMVFKDGSKKCDFRWRRWFRWSECDNAAVDRFGMDDNNHVADLCGKHWHGYIVAVHTGKIPQPHLVCKKCETQVHMNPNIFCQYMTLLDNRDHHRSEDPFYLCPNCYVITGSTASGNSGRVVFAVYGNPLIKIVSNQVKAEAIT